MVQVLHVITGLERGGAEAVLASVVAGLERQEFEQCVVSLTDRGVLAQLIEASGVTVHALGMTGFSTVPRTLWRLYRVIAGLKPAIVQTWLYHADFLGLIAARLAGGGAVAWNIRGAEVAQGNLPTSTHCLISLLARLSPQPEATVFNSKAGFAAHRMMGYRPRRSVVIANGFDTQRWRPDVDRRASIRAELGLNDRDFAVGMAARFHQMKNHPHFFAAAALVHMRSERCRFVLAGSGIDWDNTALVSEIERHDLEDVVLLLGERGDMPRVMNGLDCLVSSSTTEGFPNVIGEAMASGVPCVATDVGDSGLIVGDTGSIVAVADASAMADAILALSSATTEDMAIRVARCRARILENFSLDRMVSDYVAFYRSFSGCA
jgi:glycosyltransferase involved in cell wall biosynthesis